MEGIYIAHFQICSMHYNPNITPADHIHNIQPSQYSGAAV